MAGTLSDERANMASDLARAATYVPKKRLRLNTVLLHATIIFFCLIVLCPVLWLLTNSLKSIPDFYSGPLLPARIQFNNYAWVMERLPVLAPSLFNTLIITVPTVIMTTLFAAAGGYALAHLRLSGRAYLLAFLVMTLYIPTRIVGLIGIFNMSRRLHLLNTPIGLIAPYVALTIVLSTLVMRGIFLQVSPELIDAARMDGSSAWHTFWTVMLPMARNGIIVVAMTTFIFCWGEYVLAATLINDRAQQPLMVGLMGKIAGMGVVYPPKIFALYCLFIAPGILAFVLLQRGFLKGLQEGAFGN